MGKRLYAAQRQKKNSTEDQTTHAPLTVNHPGDRCEREADARAHMALPRMYTGGNIGRSVTAGDINTLTPGLETSIRDVQGGGKPLDANLRSFFEPRFGHDFGRVRVHADAGAARTARSLDAQAFCLDQDVFFGAHAFAPRTSAGLRLIAHELAHTLHHDPQTSCEVRRQTKENDELFDSLAESVRANALKLDFEYRLNDFAAHWREEMDERLGLSLEPWAQEALGHLTGSPYTGAEKVAGGHKVWRGAYKGEEGKYPATLVCDQLGEVTQQLFRGMKDYGSGLLGHYGYYQKNDSTFSSAVPDGSTIPANYDDERCKPGATLFNIAEPGPGKDFESHTMKLLVEGQDYTSFYDNAVPQSGIFFKDGKKAVKDKVKELRPKMRQLEEAHPCVETEEKLEVREELIDVMKRNFCPDKWISHEYTVLASVPPLDDRKGKLLFLDTFGNEKEGEPVLYGAAQPHWSSLEKVRGKGNICWGFVPVLPHEDFNVQSLSGRDTEAEEPETENPPTESQAQATEQEETPATQLTLPFDRVVMNIAGADEVYTFEVQLPSGPAHPPAAAFEYALEKLTSLRGFKIWLEFNGPAKGGEALLKELWLENQGQAVWHRPLWMTKKWFSGDFKKEQKAREKFLKRETGK